MSQYSKWPVSAGGGSGTVTSVSVVSDDGSLNITGSPILSSGTIHINAASNTALTLAYFNAAGVLGAVPNWSFDPDNYNLSNIWSISGADSRTSYSQLRLQTNMNGTVTGTAMSLDLTLSGGGGSTQDLLGINLNIGTPAVGNILGISASISDSAGADSTGFFAGMSGAVGSNLWGVRIDSSNTISGDYNGVFLNQGSTVLGSSTLFSASAFAPTTNNHNCLSVYSNSSATVGGDYRGVAISNDGAIGGSGAGMTMLQSGAIGSGWTGLGLYLNANVGSGGSNAFGVDASFGSGHTSAGGIFGFNFNNQMTIAGTNPNTAFNANNSAAGFTFEGVDIFNSANQSESIRMFFGSTTGNARTMTGLDLILQGNITDDANGVRVNMNNTVSVANDVTGLSVQMGNASGSNPQGVTGISSDGRISINATTQLNSGLGFQIGNRIESQFHIPSGSPVTGTDSIGNNFAGDMTAQDDVAVGGFGLGWVSGSMIASVGVAATKTVDKATVLLAAASLPDPGYATGGTIGELSIVKMYAPLPQGGTAVITNLYGLKIDPDFGTFGSAATNAWGLWAGDATAHNYMASDLKVGDGADTPANSSVGIELESTTKAILLSRMTTAQKNALTAVAGMAVFDTDLAQMSYYNGAVWVNV